MLGIRADVLRENGFEPEVVVCTPWRLQKVITDRVRQKWWDQKPKEDQEFATQVTAGRRDAMERTKKAYFRAAVTSYFGGID